MRSYERLAAGTYQAVNEVAVFLLQGSGDGRREVEFCEYQRGERFTIPETTNAFWYGAADDSGDFGGEGVEPPRYRRV